MPSVEKKNTRFTVAGWNDVLSCVSYLIYTINNQKRNHNNHYHPFSALTCEGNRFGIS